MKAILIDPDTQTITDVDDNFEDFREIQRIIECSCFTIAGGIGEYPNHDCVFCDDEGMLKFNLFFTKMDHYPTPLAGRILVLGATADGGSTDVHITKTELTKQVQFMNIAQVKQEYGSN